MVRDIFRGGADALVRAGPVVRLLQLTQNGGRRGRRPRTRASAPLGEFFNRLLGPAASADSVFWKMPDKCCLVQASVTIGHRRFRTVNMIKSLPIWNFRSMAP